MPDESKQRFEQDATDAIKVFPNLSLTHNDGTPILTGELSIFDKTGKEWDHFKIQIEPTALYPYRFPKVSEVGGRIPQIPDWHINSDGTNCFDVPMGEYLRCQHGMDLTQFLKKVAVPYFADQTFRLREGYYRGKEYSHGLGGIYEFFASKLGGKKDKATVLARLSRYLYFRQRPRKRKNFIHNPEGWSILDRLPLDMVLGWERLLKNTL